MTDFDDVAASFHATSALYGAVVCADQDVPEQAPILVGVLAWQMLDQEQRDASLRELLTAYVRLTRIDRARDVEEEAQALLDNLGEISEVDQ